MFTESTIRLYHKLCQKDIVYIDATGRVTLESKDYKRILLYPSCVRDPHSKTPPLPIAQYLSSNHNVESITSFFMILQEKEKNIFNGKVATPGLIMTDYSLALILSCLSEFAKESLQQYVNKSLRIIQGKSTTEKLNSTILHICFFHTMNLNWWNLQKHLKTGPKQVNVIRNVCMKWFASVTECRYLEELQELVLIGKTIFCSSNLTEELETALHHLQKHIKKYHQIEETAKSSVELIDDSNEYCSETDEAALDVEVSNKGKRTINCLDRY